MAKKPSRGKTAIPKAPQPQISSSLVLPGGYRVKRQITVPTLVMKDASPPRMLQFMDRMRLSTYLDPDPKKVKEKPATVAGVTDIETGEVFQFLVPSVVEANLRRDYDAEITVQGEGKNAKIVDDKGSHAYVGKIFRVQCLGKRPGKRYRDFSIFEVEQE